MAVSRNEMEHAASMVQQIINGNWSPDAPSWADDDAMVRSSIDSYSRAVYTAEAFIIFFQAFNPRFDTSRFLIACGLQDAPAKRRVR
jgi:phosphoenolpyruvate carboxylase